MVNSPLSVGARGDSVADLHACLRSLGFELPASEADQKIFGPATQQAIQQFQQQNELPVTGDVDEQTARAIDHAVDALASQPGQSPTPAGGVAPGSRAFRIERVHRVLTSLGYPIDRSELAVGAHGPSTIAALRALQTQRGLPAGETDQLTLEVLLELEQNITININEGSQPAPQPPASSQTQGTVQGKIVDGDGGPIPATRVVLFSAELRAETGIGVGNIVSDTRDRSRSTSLCAP